MSAVLDLKSPVQSHKSKNKTCRPTGSVKKQFCIMSQEFLLKKHFLFARASIITDIVTNQEDRKQRMLTAHMCMKYCLTFVLKILFKQQNKKW